MKKNRRDLVLFLAGIAVLVFSALSLPGKNVIQEISPPRIAFIHYWEGREDLLAGLIGEYKTRRPDVIVIPRYVPYETLRNSLFSPVPEAPEEKAGDAVYGIADVIACDTAWIPLLEEQKRIESGAFPLLEFFFPLYYNIDLLKAAGLSRPPKTRTEFLAQSRAIRERTGAAAIALALDESNSRGPSTDIFPWVLASGPDSDKAQTETIAFLAGLEKEGLLYPGSFSLPETAKREAFLLGKTAFLIAGAEELEFFKSRLGDCLGYTAIPADSSESVVQPVFAVSGWSAAVASESDHPDEARAFAAFLEEQRERLAGDWAVPCNGNPAAAKDPFYSKAGEFYITARLVSSGISPDNLRELLRLEF